MITVAGVELELFEAGEGAPLLFLHGGQGFVPHHPYVRLLAKQRHLVAPSHPGFGHSSLPDWLDRPDDIAHVYLELMDRLKLDKVDVVGCSIGGWIAAEMGTMTPERMRRLVLVSPVGLKTGPVDKLDIPDIYTLSPEALERLMFHNPARESFDPAQLTDEELSIVVRNRETVALLAWEPYMHNPKLKHRLHRLTVPTLFLRGASDGLVSAAYLERFAGLLPNAKIEIVPAAGHAVPVEQPEAFARKILAFLAA